LAFCQGRHVILTASGGTGYLWSNNSTSSSITIGASGNYVVTATDNNGCTATASQNVTVYPLPSVSITPPGPSAFCAGGQLQLTGNGGLTYVWSNNSTTPDITVTGSGTYSVTGTDLNGCTGTASSVVTVNPNPPATLTPNGPLNLCNVSGITLNANTGTGLTYEWYRDGVLIPTATGATYFATAAGNYQVKVIDAVTGCFTWTQIANLTLSGGGPVVTVNSSATIGCRAHTIYLGYGPQNIVLSAVSVPPAASYLWSTGETTQSITVTQPGTYSVTAYDASGCSSAQTPQSQITIDVVDIRCGNRLQKIILCHVPDGNPGNPQTICVAPSAIPAHLSLHPGDCLGPCPGTVRMSRIITDEISTSLYPNPFSHSFMIHVENSQGEVIHMNLTDITGRVLISDYMFTETSEFGENLSKGVYNVELIIGENVEVYKIVKL